MSLTHDDLHEASIYKSLSINTHLRDSRSHRVLVASSALFACVSQHLIRLNMADQPLDSQIGNTQPCDIKTGLACFDPRYAWYVSHTGGLSLTGTLRHLHHHCFVSWFNLFFAKLNLLRGRTRSNLRFYIQLKIFLLLRVGLFDIHM